jgi:DoxX-like family
MTVRSGGYWVSTALVALAFALGGAMDLLAGPEVLAALQQLGYPAYLAGLLGFWKLLGALAVLAPRTPLLKEWAYAGMFFDLVGASYSHARSGDPAAKVLTPLLLIGLLVASWALRPQSRSLRREERADSGPVLAPAKLSSAEG